MFNLTINTMIDAPIERVFDYMSTPENDIHWQYGVLAVATITNRLNRMGVYFRSVGHFLGRRILGTYQVIESDLNRKFRFKSLSGPLNFHTTYMFDTAGEGTNVNISIHVGTMDFFHTKKQVLAKRMKKQLRENLATLKILLEEKQFSTTSKTGAKTI